LFYLEQRVREEAQAIFEKYNLDGHEFGASLHFSSER
jgi:hypothetical protein